jgi:hypothetical protein
LDRFSPRRFLVVLGILAVGMGIGVVLDRALMPRVTEVVSLAPAPEPKPPAAQPAAPEERPASTLACGASASFDNNLYPSLMLSLGVSSPGFARCLTVEVRNAPSGKPCQIRIDSNLLQQPLLINQEAVSSQFTINPEVPWNYTTLRQTNQLHPETFVVTVTADGAATAQTSLVCIVHPVNDAVSRILDPSTGQWHDTSICFAAFVNEDHPWIGTLLSEASQRGSFQRFSGYEFGVRGVIEQLEAIWSALAARHVSYVDLATTSGGVPGVTSQYVRFLDQSLKDQGANCVDGSVLFASIFRRIGLRPVLVFVPGHCFVAVYDSPQGGHLIPFETTVLGSAAFPAAMSLGSRELDTAAPNLNSAGYSVVDIASARQAGVKPIEYEEPK